MDATPTRGERIADSVVHVTGMTVGLVAVVAMMVVAVRLLPPGSTASLAVYGAALLAMLGFSAAYHMIPRLALKGWLRRLDHAAIFLKIAGTYTPFAAIKIGGLGGYVLLCSVWGVALLGAAGKLLLASTWDRFAVPLYLALGWMGVIMFQSLSGAITPAAIVLLWVGGIVYSAGVIFHLWRNLPYQNVIWHLFVLGGTACHFGAVTSAMFA
jgi:hemolysin III